MTRSNSYSKSLGRSPFSVGKVRSWRRAIKEASASVKAKEEVENNGEKRTQLKKATTM